MFSIISAFLFTFTCIIDEAQGNHDSNNYIVQKSTSKARSLLVLKWMLFGTLITMVYKSTLRSIMMKIEYEEPIDTLDDMLKSEMILLVPSNTPLGDIVKTDIRIKVKELIRKAVQFYELGNKGSPEWVEKGYIIL